MDSQESEESVPSLERGNGDDNLLASERVNLGGDVIELDHSSRGDDEAISQDLRAGGLPANTMAMSALGLGHSGETVEVDERPMVHYLSRQQQGMAMAPIVYSVLLQSARQQTEENFSGDSFQEEDDLITSPSLPDLHSIHSIGEQQYRDESYINDNSQNSCQEEFSSQRRGDTAASTRSYLPVVSISRMGDHQGIASGNCVVEIPLQELDDPPDVSDWEAASMLI